MTLQLFSEGNLVDIAQITVAQDGSYSHTVIAEGPLWNKSGDYLYEYHMVKEILLKPNLVLPQNLDAVETTNNFEVDAGSHGTFDVEYTIKGGTVKNMVVDSDIFALIVQIDSTDEGTITL